MKPTRYFLLIAVAAGLISFTNSAEKPTGFMEKGKVLTYLITAENGSNSYSEIRIKNVTVASGTTTIEAQDQRLDDHRKSTFQYRASFYNDSVNWSVDAINHLKCPTVYSSNFIPVLESDSLVYPYAMKIGDTLLPASASEKINYGGANERHVKFTGRKVTAQEEVAVGGEAFQAFRIECKMTTTSIADYGALGKIPTVVVYDYTEWFVPSKGIVKTVTKSKTGEITTTLNGTK